MESFLRRRVSWGPSISRSDLPHTLSQTFRANQAVFNLDNYWEYIYHLIYPFFKNGEQIYFSAVINQKNSIDNYSVSKFFSLLSEIEVFSEEFEKVLYSENNINFEDLFLQHVIQKDLSLKIKAQFMSKGSILGRLDTKTAKGLVVFYVAYSALFGSEKLGWDGILDKEIRHQIFGFVAERLEANHGDMMKENLQLSLPEFDTRALEDTSKDGYSEIRAEVISI